MRWALYDAPWNLRNVVVHNAAKREYLVHAELDGRSVTVIARKGEDGGWESVRRAYCVVPPSV